MSASIQVSLCPQDHGCPALWVCPVGALTQRGFEAPRIDARRCINCGKCVTACPQGAFKP